MGSGSGDRLNEETIHASEYDRLVETFMDWTIFNLQMPGSEAQAEVRRDAWAAAKIRADKALASDPVLAARLRARVAERVRVLQDFRYKRAAAPLDRIMAAGQKLVAA
jgi:hypothetical protein